MSDLALLIGEQLPGIPPAFDLGISGGDLVMDYGLETALYLSLFTDRRLGTDDLPGDPDRRGWLGDSFAEVTGDLFGSRLYLLKRERLTRQAVLNARVYAQEAVDWLAADGVVESITASAELLPALQGVAILIDFKRPGEPAARYQFALFWSA